MTTEVEARIHKALESHPLERTADGYRLVHPNGAGVSTLRLRPVDAPDAASPVTAIAEIVADYPATGLPAFHETGVQRLNALAVHGAFSLHAGRLRQVAQYSLYAQETAAHLAAQSVLNAFGQQLPLGLSTALATTSAAVMEQQRAHHALPRQWQTGVPEEALQSASRQLQERGYAASCNATAVWAEVVLRGTCPSRSIDPAAQTALVQVNLGLAHPIAGAGYLTTISLPNPETPADATLLCSRLNDRELAQVDFVPRLGAWGLHGSNDLPGYSCFIPSAGPLGELHLTLLAWAVRRSLWVRDNAISPA